MAIQVIAADGTQDSSELPQNNVTREEMRKWLMDAKPKSVAAIGGLENAATPGVVVLKNATEGAKQISTDPLDVSASVETAASLSGAGAVSVTKRTTKLTGASGGPFALTLPDGAFDGQEVFLRVTNPASTASWVASALGNLIGFTGFTLDKVGHSLHLKWDGTGATWAVVGGNAAMTS